MENKFTTSINIIRDSDREFHYIPTPNAKGVISQLVNDYKKGLRSFNIIGTYGTGKSSFLWALERSIKGTKRYYEPNFLENPKYEFLKIVGSYTSLVEYFSDLFNIKSEKNINEFILSELYDNYHRISSEDKILFIFIDEFGKFLEYASKNNPENELYFIQQLAEFCNNPNHNIVLITTIHQSFDSYSYSLTSSQKQEWVKVKGRFREIIFNEPVEQLLYLASEHITKTELSETDYNKINKVLNLFQKSKAFNFNNDFITEIAENLYPIDILASNVLTLSLQRYGQNERSLFSFLESTDHTGLDKYNKKSNPLYNLSCVYDYLNFNFYSFLTSKYNPDFPAWSNIRSALEETERSFDTFINDYIKTIKTIGLLNIFAANGATLDKKFYTEYLETSCGIKGSNEIIDNLEKRNIIRYRTHSKRYILFEGTDLDIQTALIEAGNKITEVSDITTLLNKYFQFPPVFAKLYSYEIGTPRYFEFVISDYPISRIPKGEIDGYINLVFNSNLSIEKIREFSSAQKEAILYCYFDNAQEIKSLLFEIEKIQKVIEENKDDKVAKRELDNIVESQIRLLNHYITESIYKGTDNIQWFFKGEKKEILHKKDFNKLLSQVCSRVYYATPVFKNELVNKHKISSSIHTAKKNYLKALVNNWDMEDLGFHEKKFPPEKTIYLTLLKENGISMVSSSIDKTSTFMKLWLESEKFLEKAKIEPKRVSDLIEKLNSRPFKLKQGLIDFWVTSFLFIKRQDFAIFNKDGYIPNLSEENLELLIKYPTDYTVKTFDIDGVKLDVFNRYRELLSQNTEVKVSNKSFIETIKPFIVFYKQLPDYTKRTKRLSQSAIEIRNAITSSKDPEETFFVKFPNALGTSIELLQKDNSKLQTYTFELQSAIKELRTAYDELIKRFEEFICTEIIGKKVEFPDYKEIIQKRFSKLKKHLLLVNQKTFIQRIDSLLDDRKAWLNSVSQAVTGKMLESFDDEDEMKLYEKFKSMVLELDSLSNISLNDIDEQNEEVIGVKIDTFFSTIDPKIVRVPKAKSEEIESIKHNLRKNLTGDKTADLAAVLNLLKELMQ